MFPFSCFSLQTSLLPQAQRAAYALLFATMELGYFISQPKSTIFPVQRLVHLGLGIDSTQMAYFLTDKIRVKFRRKREELLSTGSTNERQMQSFLGSCNHLRSIFPASSLFTFHCRKLVASLGLVQSPLPPGVIDELNFWSFVDSQTDPVPFRLHRHLQLQLFTDASGYAYGADVSLPSGRVVLRDYWRSELLCMDICVKEAMAVLFALQALPDLIQGRRVDVHVDNAGLVHAWSGLKSSASDLVGVLREIFFLCVDLNVDLRLHWISTVSNPADAPSRELSRLDAGLSCSLRRKVWRWCGPLSWDLMAIPSNAFRLPEFGSLPFFSPFPVPGSSGVDVFSQSPPSGTLYAFPPFVMISPLIGLLIEWGGVRVALLLPTGLSSASSWLPRLSPFVVDELLLAGDSALGVLNLPTKNGFSPNLRPLGFGLKVYLCSFPAHPPKPSLPLPSVKVLVVSDSMFRPFGSLLWPRPFDVKLICLSGARLHRVLLECFQVLPSARFDVVLFHGGINDVSKDGAKLEVSLRRSCVLASESFPAFLSSKKILCSSVCQTRSSALNIHVAAANMILRSFSSSNGWSFVSHDNVRFSDLSDTVHLSATGVVKVYRRICSALRSL